MTDRFEGKLIWHTGSRCDGGSCIEVAGLHGLVMLRDSTEPDTVLSVGGKEWRGFLVRVKSEYSTNDDGS